MIGTKYILDGKLLDVNNQSDNTEIKDSIVVYEVFTWENNNAIFFDEHYDRMLKSIEYKNLITDNVPSKAQLEEDVQKLGDANSFKKKNIRIDLVFVDGKLDYYLVYFTASVFPTSEQYENGVEVGLCFGEREDPNSKIANSNIRKEANSIIANGHFFEVLLVNANNIITEGSRSNVFFVKGNTLFTPTSDKVLPGITRQKVIEIALSRNLEVKEVDINLDEISNYDSAFLTSTSMVVLPISKIGDISFDVENIILKELYSEFVNKKD